MVVVFYDRYASVIRFLENGVETTRSPIKGINPIFGSVTHVTTGCAWLRITRLRVADTRALSIIGYPGFVSILTRDSFDHCCGPCHTFDFARHETHQLEQLSPYLAQEPKRSGPH